MWSIFVMKKKRKGRINNLISANTSGFIDIAEQYFQEMRAAFIVFYKNTQKNTQTS
jgi:hypothetical protein